MKLSRTAPRPSAAQFVALIFGFVAMMVQAIAPICLSGFSAQQGSAGFSIVLCTAHGFQSVTLDENGKPVQAPAKDDSGSLCPMCSAFHSAPVIVAAAALLLVFLLFWQSADRFIVRNAPVPRRAYTSFSTRGPPGVRAALI
jgi:hypothetical protein